MVWISARVGCSGRAGRNLAAMRTRRSLVSMSAVEGLVLVRYQGRRARCSVTSSGWWPAVAYQQTASVRQARPNGTVRSTARAVRLGGDQGEVVAAAGIGLAEEDHGDRLRSEHRVPQAVDGGSVHGAVGSV